MDKKLIKQYIYNLTNDSFYNFAKKNNVSFNDDDEIKKIILFLKNNIEYIDINNKEIMLRKLKKEVPISTYNKSELLLNKILKTK